MTARIFHILALLLLWGFPAFAAEVVVVQGERNIPYEAAVRGFEGTAGVRTVERLVLSELRGADVVRTVREARPRLVLAVGREALIRVREIREIPVVYVMVASPESTGALGRNVTGVTMTVAPERYLTFIRDSIGGRRVGILYDPERTGVMARQARAAAERLGITLVEGVVRSPRDVPRTPSELAGKTDVLWLFPDATVLTREGQEAIFLFSQNSRVPVVAFAEKYLGTGALAALAIDPVDLGRQAGRMARRIMDGVGVESVPAEGPARPTLKLNGSVARHLGIDPARLGE